MNKIIKKIIKIKILGNIQIYLLAKVDNWKIADT